MPNETLITSQPNAEGQPPAGGNTPPPNGNQPADEGAPPAQSAAKPQGAPEKYEAFKLPEGVTLDEATVTELQGVAKDLNLSQEQAQKLVDARLKDQQASKQKQEVEQQRIVESWAEASKADKEFGGDNLQANLGTAKKALEQFATPELRTMLDKSGLGNHPEVIRHFVRLGKSISEDGRFVGTGARAPELGDARRLYPKSNLSA